MKQAFSLRYGIALILLSASVIASQITLMQILTIEQWHHFAFMVISIALLGFGAAGTVISIFRKTILKHKNILGLRCWMGCAHNPTVKTEGYSRGSEYWVEIVR